MTAAGLAEAARLVWREDASERTLRRDGRLWTTWTAWIVAIFSLPGMVLLAIEPLTFPAAAICFAHGWAIPWIQARRGARQVVPLGSERSALRRDDADGDAEAVALGLLGDLVGHAERDLVTATGLVRHRGKLGTWLVGEQGAFCVRPGGRRVDCWCVRVGEPNKAPQQRRGSAKPHMDLPAADRVAHLLLALREDELGFAKVANLGFSGATWRVRAHLDRRTLPAFAAAQRS
ncbi:MAG TPA: hypothetical protein VHF58_06930 [Solirubrobacterales bacterium]|nr:hypothetical protein [Solirubrobacterales bacterium]